MRGNTLNILLIEDSPSEPCFLLEALREAEPRRFRPFHAARLNEALFRLAENPFDAAILDLSLPDGKGIVNLRRLQEQYPELPVVVLSALDDEKLGLEALREGAQDFLVKGKVSVHTLSRSILFAVERRRLQEEKERLISHLSSALVGAKVSGHAPSMKAAPTICSYCRKVSPGDGTWLMEARQIPNPSFPDQSQGICPECAKGVLAKNLV